MLTILNILTFFWLLAWALLAARNLAVGHRNAVLFVLGVHFLLNGLPLLLDELFGKPLYRALPGMYLATGDDLTSIIYCFYVSAAAPFLWWTGRVRGTLTEKERRAAQAFTAESVRRLRPFLYLLLVSPGLVAAFAPNPQLYLTYAWIVTARGEPEALQYQQVVSLMSVLSVVAAAGLLASAPRIRGWMFLALTPWMGAAIWLNGKRYIVVFAVVLSWLALLYKGYFRRLHFIAALVVLVLAIGVFSFSYQRAFQRGGGDLYENARVDFGRDDVIKMTIFAELHPSEIQILDYRGQSLVFYATMYIPRYIWQEKPLPYAQYFTSAMYFRSPRMWGWRLTTSWLEEAIANFSWLGMLLGPALLSVICRIGDRNSNAFVFPLTALVASLFLAVHFVAFAPIFLAWILAVLWNKRWQRRDLSIYRPARHAVHFTEEGRHSGFGQTSNSSRPSKL